MVLVLDVELVDDVELVVLVLLVEELDAMCKTNNNQDHFFFFDGYRW